jgi:penicillin-binding protein 2
MKKESKKTGVFTRRALLLGAGQVTVIGVLAAKLYQVQVVQGARYATLAETNRISSRLIAPPRGRILDRFGNVVGGNKLNWRALLMVEETADVDQTLDAFAAVVTLADHERARIEREMRHRRRFIPLVVREFLSWDDMARIEVHAPDLPGILVDVGTSRLYPEGPALAHVVGYVAPPSEADMGDDPMLALPGIRVGRMGIEKFHDLKLRGRAGAVQMEVNASGRVIRELDRQEGQPGVEVGLTIDVDLQHQVLNRLGDESASQAQWIEWTSNRRAPLINKATSGVYPPGSTFKMVVAMAGLDNKVIGPGDRINCPGYLDVGDTRFHCWSKHGHGPLDVRGGLKNSCDVFFFELARRVGIDRVAAMANRFGIGIPLDIELPGSRPGLVPTRAWAASRGHAWGIGDTVNCGIGQGFVEATPLALCTYVSRVATGRAVQPHLTRTIGGVIQPGIQPADWPSMNLAERELHLVREGMFAVVNEAGGTAPLARLNMPGVQLAGKTGSSQVRHVSRELREHGNFNSANLKWEFRPHALFVCFAPFDAPRYAVSVVVEHGNAAATVAAPLARDIMTDVLTRDPVNRIEPQGQKLADRA